MNRPLLYLIAVLFSFSFISSSQARGDERNNVVLIQTDDLSLAMFASKYINRQGKKIPAMAKLGNILNNQGVVFENYITSSPLCAPSRASLISGRYPHSTGVVTNNGPYGGWLGWRDSNVMSNNFPLRLDQAGYHTAHLGKFVNYYGETGPDIIPPGWDTWISDATDESTRMYYGYQQLLERPGVSKRRIGPLGSPKYTYTTRGDRRSCRAVVAIVENCFYHTDRITSHAIEEILFSSAERKPFYIQIDYHAPHGDRVMPAGPQPAPRHINLAKNASLLKGRSNPDYNEDTDKNPTKPFLIRKDNGPITRGYESAPTSHWRRGIESMISVDEAIDDISDALKEAGEYNKTYIIFTSDNGFFFGDHRFLAGKTLAYQESVRVPLVFLNPDLAKGRSNFPVSTVDLGPTILDLAGVSRGSYKTDGTSFKREVFNPSQYPEASLSSPYTKKAQLIEMISEKEMAGMPDFSIIEPTPLSRTRPAGTAPGLKYRAIKIGRYKYINYNNTTDELYDLVLDPEEMANKINDPAYAGVLNFMKREEEKYQNCREAACALEPDNPLPAPG